MANQILTEKFKKREMDPFSYEILKSEIVRTKILFLFFAFVSTFMAVVLRFFMIGSIGKRAADFLFTPFLKLTSQPLSTNSS